MRKSKRTRVNRLLFVIGLVLFLLLVRLVNKTEIDLPPDHRFTVVKIIDGDTFVMKGGDRLRLLGIDTPEKDERLYSEAKQSLEDMILGKVVSVEYGFQRRDRYGRLLGFVSIDDLSINATLLDSGLAYLYLFKDNINNPSMEPLYAAQRRAIDGEIGLWGLKREREDYYITKTGSLRFHRPFCRSAGDLKPGNHRRFKSRIEAGYEGLSPCRTCKP